MIEMAGVVNTLFQVRGVSIYGGFPAGFSSQEPFEKSHALHLHTELLTREKRGQWGETTVRCFGS